MGAAPVEEEEGAERLQPRPNLGRGVSATQESKKQSPMLALTPCRSHLLPIRRSFSLPSLSRRWSRTARLKAVCAFPFCRHVVSSAGCCRFPGF